MSKQTEALKLALEALKELRMLGMNMQWHDSWLAKSETAITTIREALAEQPAQQQEPLVTKNKSGITLHVGWDDLPVGTKLYTSPPASKLWVGLTEEEIDMIYTGIRAVHHDIDSYVFARAIEAKLKEKNT